jgi:hypothetical protein
MKTKLNVILSLVIVLSLALSACGGESVPEEPEDISNIRVQEAEAVKTVVGTEEFPLPNCGGTSELSQSLGTHTTVQKSVTIGAKATTTAGGEVNIPEVAKLKLEVQVELAYQQTYETASSRLDTIGMKAAPGTHVVYMIQWEEHKFASTVSYVMKGEVYKAPYTYILRIPKIGDSHQASCPASTVEPTSKSIATSTPTTIPEQPTDTPVPVTAMPLQATATPTSPPATPMPPTATPAQTGAASGIRSVGEAYSANGLSLTLTDYSIGSSDIDLGFVVKNESNASILVRFQNSYFELYDDTGRQYKHSASCMYDTKQQQFEPGDTVKLRPYSGCPFYEIGDFDGVIGENASFLVVKVSQFMDLRDMQWRIDLTPQTTSEQSPSPGTILSLGQCFSTNELSLTLTDYSIGSSDIDLEFVVKNESDARTLVRFQNSYFELYDDLSNRYEHSASCMYDTKQQQFEPGDTVRLRPYSGCPFYEIGDFDGVIGENVSYLIIKVSKFMWLTDMQWRIDL